MNYFLDCLKDTSTSARGDANTDIVDGEDYWQYVFDNLRNVRYNHCTFTGCCFYGRMFDVVFDNCQFKECHFYGNDMKHIDFANETVDECLFVGVLAINSTCTQADLGQLFKLEGQKWM